MKLDCKTFLYKHNLAEKTHLEQTDCNQESRPMLRKNKLIAIRIIFRFDKIPIYLCVEIQFEERHLQEKENPNLSKSFWLNITT